MAIFKIILEPQRRDDHLHIERRGATLIINGQRFDPKTYNSEQNPNPWIIGIPTEAGGVWQVRVILPHGATAPRTTRFPTSMTVSEDGPVKLPPFEGPDDAAKELETVIADRLREHSKLQFSAVLGLNIPARLTLSELPQGVYFCDALSPFGDALGFGDVVAHVIATVALLDLEILKTAVSQHGEDAIKAALTAFPVLMQDKNRRITYIKKVAASTGQQRVYDTILWAYKYTEPLRDIRNQFAHHVWGTCPLIPAALLLADPAERLMAQAAHAQIMAHSRSDEAEQVLLNVATGVGGSQISESDKRVLFEFVAKRQNEESRRDAFYKSFNDPLGLRAPKAEVWTTTDFRNAAFAANTAQMNVVPHLQRTSQWLTGLLSEDNLEPLPPNQPNNSTR